MSIEITHPQNITYWIITDSVGYVDGLTNPNQVTTVGNGWTLYWAGSDHEEYVTQCNSLNLVPRNIDGTEGTRINPFRISARQIRIWLVNHGIALDQIDTAISSIEDSTTREIVKIEWEYAPYIERNHPWLLPLAQSLGLTEEQVDQAFIEASNI